MAVQDVSLVASATNKGTAFLEIVPQGNRVRVQRTPAGRTLNPFWTVWLRSLLLTHTDPKAGFAVEVRKPVVLVSSYTTAGGLTETVRAFASQIRPLPNPPIVRRDYYTKSSRVMWDTTTDIDLSECLRTLRLPSRARVTYPHCLWVELTRDRGNPFSIGTLALMVEHHVALNLPQG